VAPATIRLDEQSNPFWFHIDTLAELRHIFKCGNCGATTRGLDNAAERFLEDSAANLSFVLIRAEQ
jgi:hypothetical protein